MDPVEARHAALREQAGHGLVGRDHQVLDQAMRLGLNASADLGHVAVLVEGKLGLLGVDDQRAALLAPALQLRGETVRRGKRRPPRLSRGLATGEYAVDAVVVEAHV